MSLDALAKLRQKLAQEKLAESISMTPVEVPTDNVVVPATIVADKDVTDAMLPDTVVATEVARLLTCDACPNQQKTLTRFGKMMLCDVCTTKEQAAIANAPIPEPKSTVEPDEFRALSEESEDQLERLMNDPVADYLGLKIDALSDMQRRLYNEEAVRLSAATIAMCNDVIEEHMRYMQEMKMRSQFAIIIKSDKINSAKDKKTKERLLREDLAWQENKSKTVKKDGTPRIARKPKSAVVSKVDFAGNENYRKLPKEQQEVVKSMMSYKKTMTLDDAIKFVQSMQKGKS